jgi:ribosomal protein S27AE
MLTTDFHIDHDHQPVAICPNCGSLECEDNRIDDRLYIEAAREAPRLRYEGNTDDAIEVLSALYAINIVNFLRLRFFCVNCGSSFDA